MWGNSKAGLEKIAAKHPEVLENLQEIIVGMNVVSSSDNRIKLESGTHFAVISRDWLGEGHTPWLLTAYEKKESSANNNSMDTAETLSGKRNDTATPRDTASSVDKGSENSPISKELGEEIAAAEAETNASPTDATSVSLSDVRKVNVDSLMGALSEQGEATLSEHSEPLMSEQGGIDDEKENPQKAQPAPSVQNDRLAQSETSDLDSQSSDLTTRSTTEPDANPVAKIRIFSVGEKNGAKHNLNQLLNKYDGKRSTRGFISDLAVALGERNTVGKQSHYFEFKANDGAEYTLRISNHNVNAKNLQDDEKEISIVLKSVRHPNRFHSSENGEVVEYVYFKERIANGDGHTLAWIIQDITDMLNSGHYADRSGVAVVNRSPPSLNCTPKVLCLTFGVQFREGGLILTLESAAGNTPNSLSSESKTLRTLRL